MSASLSGDGDPAERFGDSCRLAETRGDSRRLAETRGDSCRLEETPGDFANPGREDPQADASLLLGASLRTPESTCTSCQFRLCSRRGSTHPVNLPADVKAEVAQIRWKCGAEGSAKREIEAKARTDAFQAGRRGFESRLPLQPEFFRVCGPSQMPRLPAFAKREADSCSCAWLLHLPRRDGGTAPHGRVHPPSVLMRHASGTRWAHRQHTWCTPGDHAVNIR